MKSPEQLSDVDLIARYEAVRMNYRSATPVRLELERRCMAKGRVHDGRTIYVWSSAQESLVRSRLIADPRVKTPFVPHYGRSIELAQERLHRRAKGSRDDGLN